ncbi:hypothetical protein GCM10009099_00670 [Caenispirillum bisanense]
MRRRLLPFVAAAVVAAGAAPWQPAAAGSAPDVDGRMVEAAAPARVISIGGPVSEVIATLGRGEAVLAADSTTAFPPDYDRLPRVGYLRSLGAEGLLSAAPDLIIAQNDAGPDQVLAQVAAAGVPVLRLPPANDAAGLDDIIARIAAILDVPQAGAALSARLQAEAAALPAPTAEAPAVLFLLMGHGGAPMAPGRDTPIHALIEAAGLRNAFAEVSGWKPIAAEALLAARPAGLIVSERTLELLGGVDGLLAPPLLARLPHLREVPVVALDPALLQGLGPRTPQAARRLAEAFGTLPEPARRRRPPPCCASRPACCPCWAGWRWSVPCSPSCSAACRWLSAMPWRWPAAGSAWVPAPAIRRCWRCWR